ncbi:hypothetical protein Glove_296g68 [Diversispora epigaea]|uniref:Uncharacterized protein n=1 Tax=Diversispora epigaea TaxID=1348612 RepID=A0A397HY78_9GLOM|nr:hypothetical protein Glove_296g68 [Diversispora epigaea]
MKGILENISERSWTAHILSYFFFITFSFLDSIQYFSCERTISTKLDLQVTDYKADGVAEFLKRPNQIPIFLLEVSGDPNKPDPDKFNNDRQKLMKEGVFALNKFMTRTKLPTWDVCKTLGVFLAQGYSNNLEIKRFKEFERKGYIRVMKPMTKYATGLTPERSRVVTFAQFLPKAKAITSKGQENGVREEGGKKSL